MAKPGTLPRIKAPATIYPLVVLVVLYFAEFAACGPTTELKTAGGLLALVVIISLTQLTATAALRMRIIYLRIGAGRALKRGVSSNRMWAVCALPIICVPVGLPRPERIARDVRIASASILGIELAVGALGATVILQGASAAFFAVDVVLVMVSQLVIRAPESGRWLVARLFRPATADRDPLLAVPAVARANHAVFDAHFGDLAAARATLARLNETSSAASTGAGFSTAILTMEMLAAEGHYAEAAQIPMPEPASDAVHPNVQAARQSAYSARKAKYLMLAAESSTAMDTAIGPVVLNHLELAAQGPTAAAQEREGRSLYALAQGDIKAAAREARIITARARTPLMLANAYCTQARIAAAQGQRAHAEHLLAEAHRIAPWYPRIAVVDGLIASPYAAGALLPPPSVPTAPVSTDPRSAR